MAKKIVYLCIPYTYSDKEVDKVRVDVADKTAAKLMNDGYVVYSPATHNYRVYPYLDSVDGCFWGEQDMPFLKMANILIIIKIAGWEKSLRIANKIAAAKDMGKEIRYMEPVS